MSFQFETAEVRAKIDKLLEDRADLVASAILADMFLERCVKLGMTFSEVIDWLHGCYQRVQEELADRPRIFKKFAS